MGWSVVAINGGYKTSETLLGIETAAVPLDKKRTRLQNLWNPFRDWNVVLIAVDAWIEALQNLWNPFRDWNASGNDFIEFGTATKPLKPF